MPLSDVWWIPAADVLRAGAAKNSIATAFPYVDLLKPNGTLALLGAPEQPLSFAVFRLLAQRRQLAGSMIGGIRETQEMLDFSAEHNITADVELIRIEQINEAYERLLRGDVKYRFVVDMASLK